jgi:hypothetical protein
MEYPDAKNYKNEVQGKPSADLHAHPAVQTNEVGRLSRWC